MVTVTVDYSQVEGLGEKPRKAIKEGLGKSAKFMIAELMKRSPVDHGLLKQWAIVEQTDTEVHIRSPAFYAGYVNYGHSQQPGRFIPGSWSGGKFRYNPKSKTGMVLKASHVSGQHFVEKSIEATNGRLAEFFTING